MFAFLFGYKTPAFYKYKNYLSQSSAFLHPLKLAHVLQKIEYSQRPWSKFSPHVQIGCTVVIQHTDTGYKRRIRLVPATEKGLCNNVVSLHSSIGTDLLGHKIGHIFECKEYGCFHSWQILAINSKENYIK